MLTIFFTYVDIRIKLALEICFHYIENVPFLPLYSFFSEVYNNDDISRLISQVICSGSKPKVTFFTDMLVAFQMQLKLNSFQLYLYCSNSKQM